MSQENVERYYRLSDAFCRRDLDAVLALSDPKIEIMPRSVALEGGGHYLGHDGVRTWLRNLLDVFPDFDVEIDGVRDLGDVTVARVRLVGHGTASDAPMRQSTWSVVEWRKGKAIWWATFGDESAAVEAAALRE